MLKALIDFLLNRKGHPVQKDTTLEAAAPYKVEAPEAPKCGCGRSPTGYCVGHHKLTDAEWNSHPDNKKPDVNWPFPTPAPEMKPAVKAKTARAKKAPVPAITAAEKPAKEKKPARPRAKKAPKA